MDSAAGDKLAAYHAKRDFSQTSEPSSGGQEGLGMFVVQHHWATRDHYDFRFELEGVLKSWAVTRGPSTDPADKRLAVRTEDHPLAYGDFEGLIPKGQYGGGTVMLWDRGKFTPLADDPLAALNKGKLAFFCDGQRMKGRWALVRMKGREGDRGRENWLLIKEKDEYVSPLGTFLEDNQTSVLTGRTRQEIEQRESRVWDSHKSVEENLATGAKPDAAKPAKKRGGPVPDFVPPMLCSLAQETPEGKEWRYEIKYDGYRLQACVNGASVKLFTREGLDWTKRFPTIEAALSKMDLPRCALDGEAVVFDERGLSDFAKLIASLESNKSGIAFVAFDVLSSGRKDLRDKPLAERRKELEKLLMHADGNSVRLSPVLEGEGAAVFQAVVEGGAEGIVAKRADSLYQSRRTPYWVKVKGEKRIDVVVVGYMPSAKRPFSSLAVALEDKDGLRFVGGVGTGFSVEELNRTKKQLDRLTRKTPPDMANRQLAAKKIVWVEPKLMAEVQYAGFTGDGQLRHARFLGWKEDRKDAAPPPAPPPKPKGKSAKTAESASGDPPRLSNPDRILWPEAGLTKRNLADYYLAVADRILPHLAGRPVSFVRAPDGIGGERFFQRHALPGMKKGIDKVPDPGRGHGDYLQVASADGLVTCAQFSVVELHGWGVVLPDLARPDRVVFDLDPDEDLPFPQVRRAAIEIRDLLAAIGLKSYALLSGGKGVHVIAPLDATQDWDVVGDFSRELAKGLAAADPKRFVGVASKEKRRGKIYIDWVRNRQTASAIVPWSPRARAKGSAAVPVDWEELARSKSADRFDWKEAAKRQDPWTDFFDVRQGITPAVIDAIRAALKS